jgi:hypothetical protein
MAVLGLVWFPWRTCLGYLLLSLAGLLLLAVGFADVRLLVRGRMLSCALITINLAARTLKWSDGQLISSNPIYYAVQGMEIIERVFRVGWL